MLHKLLVIAHTKTLTFYFFVFKDIVKEMLTLAKNYDKALEEEEKMAPEHFKNVGKQDPTFGREGR